MKRVPLMVVGSILIVAATQAAITVTSLNDSGPGTLRQAIADAAPGDTINFAVTGTITLTTGELVVSNNVTILGPGPGNLAVNGNAASRVFHITNAVTVSISSLTITNGVTLGYYDGGGAGIYNDHSTLTVSNCTLSGNASGYYGGGIHNDGESGSATLTVIGSTLSGNSGWFGGGIRNGGAYGSAMLTVIASTLSGNSAGNWAGGGGGDGGGIYNDGSNGSATLTVSASTLSGNWAGNGGGGIVNNGSGGSATLTVNASTLSGNSVSPCHNYNVGGIFIIGYNGSAPLEIGDTILNAGNSSLNILNLYASQVISDGYNLSSDDAGGFLTATGDQINTDPRLGPLADNDGPTPTHALLPGSPAIDQGKRDAVAALASDTDQRGFPRPVDDPAIANAVGGDGSDIGAFEVQASGNPPVASFTASPTKGVAPLTVTFADTSTGTITNLFWNFGDDSTTNTAAGANFMHTYAAGIYTVTLVASGPAGVRTNLQPNLIRVTVPCANQTHIVSNTNDSGPGSLRDALARTCDGDTIDATGVSGTILLTSGELVVSNSVNIVGPGPGSLAVDGDAASRVFHIINGVTATISGLSITNGFIAGWWAGGGGGIYNDHSSLMVSNCTLSGNVAGYYGGGIDNDGESGSATLTVIASTLSSNSGYFGGGIHNRGVYGSAVLTVSASTFSGNWAGGLGGAIFNGNESYDCTYFGSMPVTVSCSTLSSNSASSGGGGIMNSCAQTTAPLTVSASTFSDNSSGPGNPENYHVGGIFIVTYEGSAPLEIGDTILKANVSGVNILNLYSSPVISDGYNLSSDDAGGFLTATGDQINTDPMLGPLRDNGGPTPTHALLSGSPAIDAGQSGGLTTDQRGFPRPVDNAGVVNASGGDGSDIGAYEACAETNLVTNTNDSGPGSLRQAILAANACPGQNTIEFAPSAYGTITLTTGELTITDDLTINGPGAANLTVSGNQSNRVFLVSSGVVSIAGMTIANGMIPGGGGAGIANLATLTVSYCVISSNNSLYVYDGGGGMWNGGGTLTVRACTISHNYGSSGGGIWNSGGILSISDSTITDNNAEDGGGIRSDGGSLVIVNTTISGNSAGDGGGLNTTSATLQNCTIVNNTAWWYGGAGIWGNVDIRGCIIAGNTEYGAASDCAGVVNSDDYNLIQNTNGVTITGLTTHNIYNQDPLLGPLADNGGPTWTHALLTGSPAIGAGDPSFTPPPDFDQRGPGFPRVVSGRIDIGAFEYAYVCPGDADCDGIPDSWMYQYFEHATGQAPDKSRTVDDADGDGQSNLAEFQAGTSPTNGASAFRIVEIAPWDEDMLLSWTAVGGKRYVLQTTSGDNGNYSNNFADLNPAIIAPGTGDTEVTVLHLGGATNSTSGFYRVRLVP